MNKRSVLQILVLVCPLLLCCCAASQKQEEQKALAQESSRPEEKQKMSIAELKQLYEASRSEYQRMAVKAEREQVALCLRAIDDGIIRLSGHVSTVDEIFGTNFADRLPTEKEGLEKRAIDFAPQFYSLPRPDEGVVPAYDYVGWYLDIDYDHFGNIQNYYFSNVHKGPGVRLPDSKEKELVTELKQLYKAAQSEHERREVCLRAIDEGVIRSGGNVTTIDEIFGTHFASTLPTRKEKTRMASVDFVSSVPVSNNSTVAANTNWFLAIEYGPDGYIYNYYLTNVHK